MELLKLLLGHQELGGYKAIGVTLPTTTVISKTTYVGLIYNSTDSLWDAIGVTTEA